MHSRMQRTSFGQVEQVAQEMLKIRHFSQAFRWQDSLPSQEVYLLSNDVLSGI